MKEESNITLTTSEQRRLIVLNQLEADVLVNAEAAELLGLSVRQLRRLRSSYRKLGAAALSHGNRGRPPHNEVEDKVTRRVVELATTKYAGFNQQHLTEKLGEEEGIRISRPTVHRILKAAGVPAPRQRAGNAECVTETPVTAWAEAVKFCTLRRFGQPSRGSQQKPTPIFPVAALGLAGFGESEGLRCVGRMPRSHCLRCRQNKYCINVP